MHVAHIAVGGSTVALLLQAEDVGWYPSASLGFVHAHTRVRARLYARVCVIHVHVSLYVWRAYVCHLGMNSHVHVRTVHFREIGTGIFEASKRVPIFPFATQGGKEANSYFRQRNWVQAREAQIRFPAGGLEFDSIE